MSKLTWRDLMLIAIMEMGKIALFAVLFKTDWTLHRDDGLILPVIFGLVICAGIQYGVIETGGK